MPPFKKGGKQSSPAPTGGPRRPEPSHIEGSTAVLNEVSAPPVNPPVSKVGGSERLHNKQIRRDNTTVE